MIIGILRFASVVRFAVSSLSHHLIIALRFYGVICLYLEKTVHKKSIVASQTADFTPWPLIFHCMTASFSKTCVAVILQERKHICFRKT